VNGKTPIQMYETLLQFVSQYPKSFLYFGVGSCPHVSSPDKLEPKYDQLLPCFVRDIYQNKPSSRVQVLHVDPAFAGEKDFLKAYFAIHLPDACFYKQNEIMIWESARMQVIIAPIRFSHPNSYDKEDSTWFLDSLTEEAIVDGFQMVYQEFTGQEMKPLFLKVYETYDTNLQQRFRRQVLFDVSYGTGTGCSTDMVKFKPFYERDGSFMNLQLYTQDELLQRINTHPAINEILFKTSIANYRKIINEIHVDYRRKQNGDPLFHPNVYGYTDSSSPIEIMECLRNELYQIIPQLQKLGAFPSDAMEKLERYFEQTHTIDRYKWYELVFNLVKFEQPPFPATVQ
jgi:hypothetical protein